MSEKLIIWMTDADARSARWLVLDANGNRAGFPQQGALADAASLARHRRVIVLLPGERVLAASARVPGRNTRHVLQAAPYALEETLAGDVETLHVALLARDADKLSHFLVTSRDWLAAVLGSLAEAGISADAMWPDYFGVPTGESTEHWLLTGNGRLLAHHEWHGFAASASDAAFMLGRRDNDTPLSVTVVGDQPLPAALTERETARMADSDQAFTELAAAATRYDGPGLLQGEFRRRRDEAADWRRWSWPAIAAGAWLVLALASHGLDIYRMQREHAFLEQTTRDLFQQALPGRQRMVDPRYQIEQVLGSAGAAESPLLAYVAQVGKALQSVPEARLNGFNFRNDYLEFSVTVPNATALESLSNTLAESSGQNVEVRGASSTEDGLEGRIVLGAGGRG